MIQLTNENLGFKGDIVLRDISLNIAAGERVALIGESGAGKSTLLSVLQSRYRSDCAFIPQNPGLVRTLSVFHNVYIGSLHRHNTGYNLLNLVWPRRRQIDIISPIVERLGMQDKLFTRAGELSGGQQQRVAICRAILQGGSAVLGDEPVSAADNHQSRVIMDTLCDAFDTVILAMHDVELALQYATRVVGIRDGQIVIDQSTDGLELSDLDFLYQGQSMTRPEYSPALKVSLAFVAIAFFCLVFADLSISTLDPWTEMQRMAFGLMTPDFFAVADIARVIIQTIAFALCGVALGAFSGFFLAQLFHIGPIRWTCAFVRAIHEIFWALILLQILGLTPLTGVLAIAIPYAGICAKVYAETLEESQPAVEQVIPVGSSIVSIFFFARLPDVWVHIRNYTGYRFECGLRSSAVLGFIGLPTLGFYLETAFSEGNYSEAAALLILFYVLIASLRYWLRPRLLPLYLLAAPFLLGSGATIEFSNVLRFFGSDIIPAPLRNSDWSSNETWNQFADWMQLLLVDQALPGVIATVVLSQIALVATGLLTLALFPLISEKFFGRLGRGIGHIFLVVVAIYTGIHTGLHFSSTLGAFDVTGYSRPVIT